MLWYEALLPAAVIAIAVRLEAIFLLPYWSWLQLIPELGTTDFPEERKKKNRALIRRIAIPLLVGLFLVAVWPSAYGPPEVALVSALGAALLLWPLFFASFYYEEVRSPPWLAWFLYALMVVVFVASGLVGGFFGAAIVEKGGFVVYLREEFMSLVLPAIALLFASALFSRASDALAENREREIDDNDTTIL